MNVLVGRSADLDYLTAFLAERGGTLLLTGEPGVGKTALLDAAEATETGVIRVPVAEYEAEVAFAGLNRALLPLLDEIETLGEAHERALRVALGLGAGPMPEPLLLASAVTLLLRRGSHLLIVDDLQWIDRASAQVFSFVARRLGGSRAAVLAAFRTGGSGFFDRSGLREYEVRPLDEQTSAVLLAERFPALDPRARDRVLATARGNPLALLELPQALGDDLPSVLPLGERLQRLYADRIAALPAETRAVLLTAALEGAAAAGSPRLLDALEPAERDDLVRVDGGAGRVVFRHPLIRSAVVTGSTAAERRRAHQALAAAFPGDVERRAWHLGEAATGPDEQVAALLEEAAQSQLRRGDYQAMLATLTRAADLSPHAAERARRLAEAAYVGAEYMGEARSAAQLLAEARRAAGEADASLHYAAAAALVMLDSGTPVDVAHAFVLRALRTGEGPREGAQWMVALLAFFGGRAEMWAPLHDVRQPDLRLAMDLFGDPVRTGVAALPRFEAGLAAAQHDTNLDAVLNLVACGWFTDRIGVLRGRLLEAVHDGGPARLRLVTLMNLSVDDFHRGAWAEQAELVAEGLSVSAAPGTRFFRFYFWYHEALLHAVHGRSAECRARAEHMLDWAAPIGVGLAATMARHALVLEAYSRNDFDEAYRHAARISPPGTFAPYVPIALWVAFDLVYAALRTGRRHDAEAHVRAMREADVAALSPRLAILSAACEALVSDDDTLFARTLAMPTVERWPFDAARIRLAYGERLRRSREAVEARHQLEIAHAAFRRLGAGPWADRAEAELRAAGQATRTPAGARGVESLTPQELQIARMAAGGMTNKEIAERLFLSPRTVGGHLYQVFPKLGITKRAALRDAIGDL
ncbi:LuxR C-terminal-related transcriptional regulator [Actinoplanes sp. NPDC048988]|uniref:helix-turn-helix transcriptional regulator n=1 Tax=Actinoplanes sp. NPDC048988 TaxID=3363901 RepID=UPI0037151656